MRAAPNRLSVPGRNILQGIAMFVFCCLIYVIPNRLMGDRPGVALMTSVDTLLPFWPASVLGWIVAVPLFLLPFVVIRQRALLVRAMWGYVICTLTIAAVYFAFPARVARPGIPTQENFFYWSVALTYILDNPVTCMPAMTTTLAAFSTLSVWLLSRPMGLVALVLNFVVGFSSLTLRQHFIADLLAGVLVAFAVYWLFMRPHVRRALAEVESGELLFPPKIASQLVYLYLGLIGFGLLVFEAGVRYSPVLPTN